tara:strand:+ start:2286 stop:2444 length:159 start_codon:yes stop_codon:yes gene_type:complete
MELSTKDLENEHLRKKQNYTDYQQYYNKAFLANLNVSIGILFIAFMIVKNRT